MLVTLLFGIEVFIEQVLNIDPGNWVRFAFGIIFGFSIGCIISNNLCQILKSTKNATN